jgi:predicted phage tail protein
MARPAKQPLRTLERGILCLLIGAAVLLGPRFLQGTRWFEMVAGASVVGWFAVVLGVALIVLGLVKRGRSAS